MSAIPTTPPRDPRSGNRRLGSEEIGVLAERFSLLSDRGRLGIVCALLGAGELCVGDLAEVAGSTQSATSHRLRRLRAGGMVRARKDGRSVYYRLADDHVQVLLEMAAEHFLPGESP